MRIVTSTIRPCAVFLLLVSSASTHAARAQSAVTDELKRRVEQLRVSGKLVINGLTVTDSSPLGSVYEKGGFTPLWSDTRSSAELVRVLRDLAAEGLDPADYNLSAIEPLAAPRLTPGGLAELDLLRTDALIRASYDLRFGKVDAQRPQVRRALTGPLLSDDAGADIRRMIASGRLYDHVLALRPDHFVYRGLASALARLRRIEQAGGWARMPAGPPLRLDSADTRVPLLRQRLVLAGDLPSHSVAGGLRFDEALERAVRAFQHRHGLNPDGVVGPSTLAQLNVPVAARINQIRLNLERARWVIRDLPDTFVVVNIAGAMVYFVRAGNVVFETRAVVGRAYTATPMFREDMRYIDLNPTWTVPPSIAGEVLAAIRRNPDYLRAQNIRVLNRSGQPIAAANIDFSRYTARNFPYVFRQEPGPKNPLGRIKFMLPNRYNVYLHDTPQHELFEREQRTFSHGCIRVHEPLELAALILNDSARWSPASLQVAISSGVTRTINLEVPVPVLLLYWTASADLHGELHFYRDVYHRDEVLLGTLDQH